MTGPNFRKLREKANVSQYHVALAAHVCTRLIVDFERGGTIGRESEKKLIVAYGRLSSLPKRKLPWGKYSRPYPAEEPELRPALRPGKRARTGHAMRGAPRPGAMAADAPDAGWNGVFNAAWLQSQIAAWIKGGVTLVEMRQPGSPETAPLRSYMATESQIHDLGRRLTVALTGKNLQG